MKANELRNLTNAELEQKLDELKEELFNLRFQNATVQLDNPARIKEVKKSIARVKTILNERELGINQG
ncbi:50S ribosomal protein L29 [Orenia metallireducens]|uniref:Large ribosomal subunit protein uL29 n=1 Tax=Orenia metallireducens TaxID=1413210 RepID=A0A1C0ABU0_9FIRM|nr:50S ribosomal protein L29 [Orenia metallireducens]OCL27831.1 50S ribosomal protein L29 [Orenia metallireducens]